MAFVCFDPLVNVKRRDGIPPIFSSIRRVFLFFYYEGDEKGEFWYQGVIPPPDASASVASHGRRHQLSPVLSISHQSANRAEASTCLLSTVRRLRGDYFIFLHSSFLTFSVLCIKFVSKVDFIETRFVMCARVICSSIAMFFQWLYL